MIRVQVIAAWPHCAHSQWLELPEGGTVADALALVDAPLRLSMAGQAIFGVAVRAEAILQDGDRLELLRSLEMDPKAARRLRAQSQREERGAREVDSTPR